MVPTPHISAKIEDIAATVIMPGDPLRSKFIADTFLTDAKLINNVRGVQGYTGYYKGKRVTVMASGMGNASMGIYSYELFAFYGVENIIRVGTAGTFLPNVALKDIVVAKNVFTKTNFDGFFEKTGAGKIAGSDVLLNSATKTANKLGFSVRVGDTLCTDTFYTDEDERALSQKHGLVALEMEGASLYLNAKKLNKNALVICTISDNIATGEKSSSNDRQRAFTKMMELALELA